VRHLYLAATGQDRGKTTASLGLVHALLEAGLRTGFTKPVGPRSGSVRALVGTYPISRDPSLTPPGRSPYCYHYRE